MSGTVRMVHPDLPGQPIHVPEAAVPHYANSGWVPEDEPERAPAKALASAEKTDSSVPAPEKPSRRRTPKEGEEQ